jgi:hypothetical protein
MMKQLFEENVDLGSVIADLHQQIAAIDAENEILKESLSFFQAQIGNSPPAVEIARGSLVAPANE